MNKIGTNTQLQMEVLKNRILLPVSFAISISIGCWNRNNNNLNVYEHNYKYQEGVLIDSCLMIDSAFYGIRMTYELATKARRYTTYLKNIENGQAIMYYNDVLYLKGQYLNGKQCGVWYTYWPNGKTHRVTIHDFTGMQIFSTSFDTSGFCQNIKTLQASKSRSGSEIVIDDKNIPGADLSLIFNTDTDPIRKYETRIPIPMNIGDSINGFYEIDDLLIPVIIQLM